MTRVDGAVRTCHWGRRRGIVVRSQIALPTGMAAAGHDDADPITRGETMRDDVELESDGRSARGGVEADETLAHILRASVRTDLRHADVQIGMWVV